MNKSLKKIIECTNLSRIYHEGGNKTPVLNDVSFTVERGEQVAIVGSSGSGKSTLLHLLGTLDKPESGRIVIDGVDILTLSEKDLAAFRNERLGFIYQFHHLLMDFNALENVCMPLLISGMAPAEASKKATDILSLVGLENRITHRPSALSGGERQRVAIARALVTQPTLVLADEPTGNLDHQNAMRFYELLNQLNDELKTSFVVVTHDNELAASLDRTLKLVNGQLERVLPHV